MTKLDEIAVNVELVLISLIQGLALILFAQQIMAALGDPEWYRYITFTLAGLAILLTFWAQSILRAMSFTRWPIRIEHLFLYFVVALAQMIAYSNILSLSNWFFWWSVYSLVVMAMYFLDLQILRDSFARFAQLRGGSEFLERVEKRHIFEMTRLVPAALALNVLCWLAAIVVPRFFQPIWIYAIPGALQLTFSIYLLYDCMKNFRVRSEMISVLFAGGERP
jgi:hypothetical protein